MLAVAHTTLNSDELHRLHSALPRTQLLYTSVEQAERLAADRQIAVLVVTDDALKDGNLARLAVLKARHPNVSVLAYLHITADLGDRAHCLGRAQCDGLFIHGVDDHPELLRRAFASAAVRSVAWTIERASSPAPPLLAATNLESVLRRIDSIKKPSALAAALGASLVRFRRELQRARLFPPRTLLGWFRILTGSCRLDTTEQTAERIGIDLGYASGPAFRNACRHLLAASPREVRNGGGLGYAAQRYRAALRAWRGVPAEV